MQAVNFNQNILGKMFMQKRDASHTLMKNLLYSTTGASNL